MTKLLESVFGPNVQGKRAERPLFPNLGSDEIDAAFDAARCPMPVVRHQVHPDGSITFAEEPA